MAEEWHKIDSIYCENIYLKTKNCTYSHKITGGSGRIVATDQEVVRHSGGATWSFTRVSDQEVQWVLTCPPQPLFGEEHFIELRVKIRYGP